MALPLNTHTNSYVFGRGKIYIDLFDTGGNGCLDGDFR